MVLLYVNAKRGDVDGRLYHVNMPLDHLDHYGDQLDITQNYIGVFVPDSNVYQGVEIPHYTLPVRHNGQEMMLVCNKPCTFYEPPTNTQRIPNELRKISRQAIPDGLILQEPLTPSDWALVRPGPSLRKLQTYSVNRQLPIDDLRARSNSWTMNRATDDPLRHFGERKAVESGTLANLRYHNYSGNPPDVDASDTASRTSLWSLTHNSPLPSGIVNEERFEERNGRPGFWHEIVLPVDRQQAEASTKTVDGMRRTFPAQVVVTRFEPITKEVWIPWQEQYEPYDFTMREGTEVNQYYIMNPVPSHLQMPGQPAAENTKIYEGTLNHDSAYRFFPRPLEYKGHQQRIRDGLKRWARRDNCHRCVPLVNGRIAPYVEPLIRQPHSDEEMVEKKAQECKVQPSLFKQMVKSRHQKDTRTQYNDNLTSNTGPHTIPYRAITPVVRPPKRSEIPKQVTRRGSKKGSKKSGSGGTSMDEGASGSQTPTSPRRRAPSPPSTIASGRTANRRTLGQRWRGVKGAVTGRLRQIKLPNMLPSCCRRRGCTNTGPDCTCGHHEQEGGSGGAMPMSTFYVPVEADNDPDVIFWRNLRPCCQTQGCNREGGCFCDPPCFGSTQL